MKYLFIVILALVMIGAKPTSKEKQYIQFFKRSEHLQIDYQKLGQAVYRTDIYDGPLGSGEVHHAWKKEADGYYCLVYHVGPENRKLNLEWEKLADKNVPEKVKELLP